MESNGKENEDIYVQLVTETPKKFSPRKFRVTHRKVHYDVTIRRDDVTRGIKEVVHLITGISPKQQHIKYMLNTGSAESEKPGHSKRNNHNTVFYSKSAPDSEDCCPSTNSSKEPKESDMPTMFDKFKEKRKVDINENVSKLNSANDLDELQENKQIINSKSKQQKNFTLSEDKKYATEENRIEHSKISLDDEDTISHGSGCIKNNTVLNFPNHEVTNGQVPGIVLYDEKMKDSRLPDSAQIKHNDFKTDDDESSPHEDNSSNENTEHKNRRGMMGNCKISVLDIDTKMELAVAREAIVTTDDSTKKKNVDISLLDNSSSLASSESTPPPVHKTIQKLKRNLRTKKRKWFRKKKGDQRTRDHSKEESTSTDECTRKLPVPMRATGISLEDDKDVSITEGECTNYEEVSSGKEDANSKVECSGDADIPEIPGKENVCYEDIGDETEGRRCRSDEGFAPEKDENLKIIEKSQNSEDVLCTAYEQLAENENCNITEGLSNMKQETSDSDASKEEGLVKNELVNLNEENSDSSSGISVSFDKERNSPTGASDTSADTGCETGSLISEFDRNSSSPDVAKERKNENKVDEKVNDLEVERSTDDVEYMNSKEMQSQEVGSSEKRGKIHRKLKKTIFSFAKRQEKYNKRNNNVNEKMKFWKTTRKDLKKMLSFFQKHYDSESDDSDWSEDETSSNLTSDEETSSVTSQRTITPQVVKRKDVQEKTQAKKPQASVIRKTPLQSLTKQEALEPELKKNEDSAQERYKILKKADKTTIPRYNYKDPRTRHLAVEEDLSKYKEIVTLNSEKTPVSRSVVKESRAKSYTETHDIMTRQSNANNLTMLDNYKRTSSVDPRGINNPQLGLPSLEQAHSLQFPVQWIPTSRDLYEPIRSPGFDSNGLHGAGYYDSNFHLVSGTFSANPNPQRYFSEHLPPPRRYYPSRSDAQNPYNYTRQGTSFDYCKEDELYDGYYSSRKSVSHPSRRNNYPGFHSELYNDISHRPNLERCYEQRTSPMTFASNSGKNEDDFIVNLARMLKSGEHDQDCVSILHLSSKLFELASAFEWKDVYQIFSDLMRTSRSSNPGNLKQNRTQYVSQMLDREVKNALASPSTNFNERRSRRQLIPTCHREVAKTTLNYPQNVLKVSCPSLLCKEFNTTGFCRRQASGLRCEYLHSCKNCAARKNRNLPHPEIECVDA